MTVTVPDDELVLTQGSLFTGIGGFELAGIEAGFTTAFMCEIDDYCQALLHLRFAGVPLIGDVHDVTKASTEDFIAHAYCQWEQQSCGLVGEIRRRSGYVGEASAGYPLGQPGQEEAAAGLGMEGHVLSEAGRHEGTDRPRPSDRQHTDTRATDRLTLLTAGVPCQPASVAGKRRGASDDRWLWPETIRVLGELQPRWALFENPYGITSLAEPGGFSKVGPETVIKELDRDFYSAIYTRETSFTLDGVLEAIEAQGYEVGTVCIPACAVGAPHRRDRIFIVCHSRSGGLAGDARRRSGAFAQDGYSQPVADAGQFLCPGQPADGYRGDRYQPSLPEVGQGSEYDDTAPPLFGWPALWSEPDGQRGRGTEHVADAEVTGLQGAVTAGRVRPDGRTAEYTWQRDWAEVAAELCRVDDGFPAELDGLELSASKHREHRIKALGNAVMPEQPYPIMKFIADYERGLI